jgi:hypothetical protein
MLATCYLYNINHVMGMIESFAFEIICDAFDLISKSQGNGYIGS